MAGFPYVLSSGKFPGLLNELRTRGRPAKVTTAWLEAAGFKSKNDRRFIALLKFLGIIDSAGSPTDKYDLLMHPEWHANLAQIVRDAYADLFSYLPDAQVRPAEQLVDQFRMIETGSSLDVLKRMVKTFQDVCSEGDFGAAPPEPSVVGDSRVAAARPGRPVVGLPQPQIAVQINLDPSMDAEQIDKVFESMAKHIYGMAES